MKDARLPAGGGSPWIEPGTFVYPLKQRWFASNANGQRASLCRWRRSAGRERSVPLRPRLAAPVQPMVAATAGRVISSGTNILSGYGDSQRSRVMTWFISSTTAVDNIATAICRSSIRRAARSASASAKSGVLGKEGGGGGWSHLRFDITGRQPSGLWKFKKLCLRLGSEPATNAPEIIAVARLITSFAPAKAVLTARNHGAPGSNRALRLDVHGRNQGHRSTVERTYSQPGYYSEVLKITDARGEIDYDFAVVM